jgi:anti-sigma factor RsiW
LDAAGCAQVEKHVNACAACSAFVAEQKQLWASLDVWKDVSVPADFDERLMRRIAEEEQRGNWRMAISRWQDFLSLNWRGLAAGAAASTVLAIALLVPRPAPEPDSGAPAVSAQAVDLDSVDATLADLELLTPVQGAM